MKVVFIGAGNLATNLSEAMLSAGFEVLQVYSRTEESARNLGTKLGCLWTCDVSSLDSTANLYIISVSDKAISEVLDKLDVQNNEAVFCHTAGSVGMNVFEGKGFDNYGVFYPMQTFSKNKKVDFRNIPIFIEYSNNVARCVLTDVAEKLSDTVYVRDSKARKALHISAVFACNFVNHMYDISARLLEEHNIPFDVMFPLVDETAAKVHEMKPKDAQTGPAVRGDVNVMKEHLLMLEKEPELKELYELISKNIRKWGQ